MSSHSNTLAVPMNAFQREPESLIQAELDAVQRTLRSGWWVLGNDVSRFESAWSGYCKSTFAVGVGNGMDALEIGLRALNIGPGDEVITTPMTAFATVLAILRAGATPVLADIDPNTGILDSISVVRCITPKTRAVLVVHLYGQAAPISEFQSLCKHHDLHLIEDCAQAHGAQWEDQPVGQFGAFAGWSFYPTKNLGTVGDGGALTTNSAEIAESAKRIRNYGQSVRYQHPEIGMNSRLDELHAAILLERFAYLPQWTARRQEIARMYHDGIDSQYVKCLNHPVKSNSHVYHLFVVTSPRRDNLSGFLKDHGIENLIHYPIPVHHQVPCKNLSRDPHGLVHAEKHAQTCLSIPCNPFLTDEEIQRVITTLNAFPG